MPVEDTLPLVDVSGVEMRFGSNVVLTNIDLRVGEGEFVTLIGPNGSGKSTLVRIVLGLLTPQRGRVYLRPGVRVGYMPQRVAVDPTLPITVGRFLTLGTRASRPRLNEVLHEVGAERVIDHAIQDISGGELQRVLLARALLRDPDLLVLDEPVQGVDVTGQGEMFELISSVRDRHGCGVLMVSHDLHLVMAATDTVICLNRHVCCSGHPEAVSRHPAYLALFGPLADRGLAVYTHRHDHRHETDGEVTSVAPGEAPHG